MNQKTFIIAVCAFLFIQTLNAAVIRNVDNFEPDVPLLQTFLDSATVPKTVFAIANGEDTIGVERDQILHLNPGPIFKIASSVVTDGQWVIGWSQNTNGVTTLQYDGADNSINLNLNPGLAQYDLTEARVANAFILQISADHNTIYTINIYGSTASIKSSYTFTAVASGDTLITYHIPFSSFTGTAVFTQIHGIELTMDNTNAGGLSTEAIDTTVQTFATFGYQVSGSVYSDCDSSGTQNNGELPYAGANVTLTVASSGAQVATAVTDLTGAFTFAGLNNITYNVCVGAAGATRTVPASGCLTATPGNLNDVVGLLFGLRTQTTVIAPENKVVECGACIDPECTGTATASGCGATGGPTPTFVDSNSTNVCPKVITRTWSIAGVSGTAVQIIRVNDTTNPTITVQPTAASVDCSSPVPTLANWVSTHAGAQATDCNGVTWTSNWNNITPSGCAQVNVTFTASDPCGNSVNTTSSYTITDGTAPVFTTAAQSVTTECNKNGNDLTAFNSWLGRFGDAVVNDTCTSVANIGKRNNYVSGLTTGCLSNTTVTFTATDSCGASTDSIATYTISDTLAPVITQAARNNATECGPSASAVFNSWLTAHGFSTASDQCTDNSLIKWTNDFEGSVPSSCNLATTVNFFATDICGKVATTFASFTVTDNTPPVLTNPAASESYPCSTPNIQTLYQTWLDSHAGATATDACTGSVNWSNNANSNPTGLCGAITVTFTASDLCATPRSVSTIATFTVTDNVNPVYTVAPQDLKTNCAGNTQTAYTNWLASQGSSTVTDNCSTNFTLTHNGPTTAPTGCKGSARVTFTAADQCNNRVSAAATFSVEDNSAPTFNTLPQSKTVECGATSRNDYVTWRNSNAGASVTDDCNSFTVTPNGPASINNGCLVVQAVNFTATDVCGNSDFRTASFTIEDKTSPFFTTQASNKSVECDGTSQTNALNNWLNSHGGAVASDACRTTIEWKNDFESLTGEGCVSSAFVTFTADDGCGNTAKTSATFTITDTSIPTIVDVAKPQTVQCDGYGNQEEFNNWLETHAGSTATDACVGSAGLKWTNNFGVSDLFTCGVTTVTFTVTDQCGDSANTTASFTVRDNIQPTFSPAAQNLTVECDGYGNVDDYANWIASNGGATPLDACATFLSITTTAPVNGPVGCGSQIATFIATDDCNNSGRTTATYTVKDSTSPVIVTPAASTNVECNSTTNTASLNAWLSSQGGAVAIDQCTSVSWTNNYQSLVVVNGCATSATVTFTATDRCNNIASTFATFSITDNTPPTMITEASDIVIQCNEFSPRAIATWLATHGGANATDSCTVVRWTNNWDPEQADDSCSQPIPVTFTASDLCGNSVQTTATLTLTDTVSPIFVNFPEDTILNCDQSTDAESVGIPIAADACTSNIEVTWEDEESVGPTILLCPGNQNIVRTFFASDNCGNSVTKSQNIVVNIARTMGPCNPEDCPPCNSTLSCCSTAVPQVACNPVPCNAVACNPVACIRVPCTPVTAADCTEGPTGNYIPPLPYGGGVGNHNGDCEPIYIYIFDDDDNVGNGQVNYEYVYVEVERVSSAPSLPFVSSLLVVLISIFALF